MTQIDEAIRRALSPEDVRAYDALTKEQSIVRQAVQAFQAQDRLVAVAGWVGGLLLFAAGAFCVWRFVQAPTVRDVILWGAGAALALTGLGMIKLWFWMEMQKNSIVREVKRLELQIATLVLQRQS